jgi:hypothetical protein
MIGLVDFLCAAHSWAYRTGRHRDVIRLTVQLNAMRGLRLRRADDVRCDVQFDHDEERLHGWAAP